MLKYIQIDTFFEALQSWVVSILELVGLLFGCLILLQIILQIPIILVPVKQFFKKWFFWYFFDNPFLSWILKKSCHALIGLCIMFCASVITGALYGYQNVKIDPINYQDSYSRLEKNNIHYTPLQREWIKNFEHIMEYSPVIFIILFIFSGIFFMLWSAASFFQKISYCFFCACFFWYLISISWRIYIDLASLIDEDYKAWVIQNINL